MNASAATILVVDDEVQNRKLLELLLQPEGHTVVTAGSGEEALAQIARQAPDLILLDILMPGMNGYDVAKAVKANPATSNIPIIMITTAVGRESQMAGLDAGAEEFLLRPVDRGELYLRVRNLLRLKTLGDFFKNHSAILERAVETRTDNLKRLNRVYAVLSQIDNLIIRATDRDELFREACRIAVGDGGFKLAWIGVVERGTKQIRPVAWKGATQGYLERVPLGLDEAGPGFGLAGRTVRDGKPVIVGDLQLDPGVVMRAEARERGFRSLALLPLAVSGSVVGVLALYADQTGFFNENEMKLLVELAGDIAFAVDHIEAAAKLEHITRVNAMLSGVNSAIVRIRDRQELLDDACRIAVEDGGLSFAWLCLVDEVEMRLQPVAWAGEDHGFHDMVRDCPSLRDDAPGGHGLGARSVRERRALVVHDVQSASGVMFKAQFAELGSGSIASLPLFVADRVVGVLSLHAKHKGFFDEREMKLLSEVAANIAFALEHIEKEEKVSRLTRVYAVLSGINTLIVRVHERDELFTEACRLAVEDGQFKMAWIGLVDRDQMKIDPVASAGAEPEFLALIKDRFTLREDAPLGNTLSARAVREKRAIVSNEIRGDQQIFFMEDRLARGIHSIAILPLLIGEEVVGVLALYAGEPGFFDAAEMKLLNELASDIGFALGNMKKAARLDYLAYYDTLTGLPNRTLFLETLKKTLSQATSHGWLVAVLFLDLDHFKNVNDTLGHTLGDELLGQVGARLVECVRLRDTVGRLGGDEFGLILLMEEGPQGAVTVANKVRDALRPPFQLGGHAVTITASIGITVHPVDASDPDELIKYADTAMYRAKQAGRDTLRCFTAEMNTEALARLELETALRKAIENNEFVLHYQPKVAVKTGRVSGVEALLRWQRPGHGLVPPRDFIPVLEETGLIVRVGSWVIAEACRQLGLWTRSSIGALPISVNVSGRQFMEGDLDADVAKALADNGVAPGALELELTEGSLMANTDRTIALMKSLKNRGVQVSIDDFGTGYSSLAYLRRFPIDKLKIDIAFIRNITTNPDDAAIAVAIIRMAHSLKLEVIAEGVETAAQLAYLRRHRCDHIQGYYFSMPLPLADLESLLLGGKRLARGAALSAPANGPGRAIGAGSPP